MKFDLPKDQSSIIKVIGVGGGGSNAVNHMFHQGIEGVDFVVCNTDVQALEISPVPTKIQLGISLTEGRGAGSLPDVGKNAAIESIDEVRELLAKNAKMVFVTAGMGGGTGTGAAPVIAEVAREMGILTVGIVTIPFAFEGERRKIQAEEGIKEIRQHVDTLLVINNDKLREISGNLPLAEAFAQADNVLTTASKGIAEIITRTGYINVDFEDVRTVMTNSGVAIMGLAAAEGEDRARKAVETALASPLLNDNNIQGARYVLLNITFGKKEVLMDEISDITDYIKEETASSADVIWGYGQDESLGESLCVTIIATGFNTAADELAKAGEQENVVNLEDDVQTVLTSPVEEHAGPAEPELKTEETEETTSLPLFTSSFDSNMDDEPEEEEEAEMEEETPLEDEPVLEEPVAEADPEPMEEEEPVQAEPETEDVPLEDPPQEEEMEEVPAEETQQEISVPIVDPILNTDEQAEEQEEVEEQEEPANEPAEEPVAEDIKLEEETTETVEEEEEEEIEVDMGIKRWNDMKPVQPEDLEEEPAEQATEPIAELDDSDEKQTVEFDITSSAATVEENGVEEPGLQAPEPEVLSEEDDADQADQQKKAADRIMKLKELSMKLRTPSGISDLESEPAYKRKDIQLDETTHSSDSEVSRYTLTESEEEDEDGEKKTELKDNNSFLHDNVD